MGREFDYLDGGWFLRRIHARPTRTPTFTVYFLMVDIFYVLNNKHLPWISFSEVSKIASKWGKVVSKTPCMTVKRAEAVFPVFRMTALLQAATSLQ